MAGNTANTQPLFEYTPVIGATNLATANPNNDGSGTIATLITGVTFGTRIDSVRFINSGSTAATSSARRGTLYLSLDSGVTWSLFDDVAISATLKSVSAVGDKNDLNYSLGLTLKDSTQVLGCAITVYAGTQDRTTVIARGGHLS